MKSKERAAREYAIKMCNGNKIIETSNFPMFSERDFLAGVEWAKNEAKKRWLYAIERGGALSLAGILDIGEAEEKK